MAEQLTGLIAAPFTPMRADGSVNLDMIETYAHTLAANGVAGAFPCGTTGESLSLAVEERMAVAGRWQAVAPDGLAVIVHVGHNCLADAKALAAHAQKIGARAIGAMGPCFFKPGSVDDLVAWCTELAAAAPGLPFYYYHIPSMTGVQFPMVEFLRKGGERIPTLAGIKYTWEDMLDFGRCLTLDGGRFNMLFGRDEALLAGLALGATGAVGSSYNYAAPLYVRLIKAFNAGDMAAAREAQARSRQMIATVIAHGYAPSAKALMKLVGVDCGPVRLPMRPLPDDELDQLRAELDAIGFADYCMRPAIG